MPTTLVLHAYRVYAASVLCYVAQLFALPAEAERSEPALLSALLRLPHQALAVGDHFYLAQVGLQTIPSIKAL